MFLFNVLVPTRRVGMQWRRATPSITKEQPDGTQPLFYSETKAPHFLTCAIINWIPVFTRPQTVDIILNALQYRQQHNGWKVYGYVILENHLHLVVQADDLLAVCRCLNPTPQGS